MCDVILFRCYPDNPFKYLLRVRHALRVNDGVALSTRFPTLLNDAIVSDVYGKKHILIQSTYLTDERTITK